MPRIDLRYLVKLSAIYMAAIGAGWVCVLLHVPLPWMIGPLLLTASLSMSGIELDVPRNTRHVGQVVVAAAVGLTFTPAALTVLIDQAGLMVAAAAMTLLAGFVTAAVMRRFTEADTITASLCCVPLGPMEAANLAVQYGVSPGPVAFVQTLRIALTVTLIPPILVWLDPRNLDLTGALSTSNWTPLGVAFTLAAAVAGAGVFHLCRISNPMFLGGLAGAGFAMLFALPVSALPYAVIAGGQILLGVWLGASFTRELLARAGTFIPAAVLSTLLLLMSCASVGIIISLFSGVRTDAMVLATAPGSVTEMALTAKILAADPAMVTGFHVVRIFMLIPFAPLIFRMVGRLAKWGT